MTGSPEVMQGGKPGGIRSNYTAQGPLFREQLMPLTIMETVNFFQRLLMTDIDCKLRGGGEGGEHLKG